MKTISLVAIIFGILIIAFPEIIAYLLGTFLIFLGLNGLFASRAVSRIWRIK